MPLLSKPEADDLTAGFANPPAEARLRCYWWWLNGNTTAAAITRDLEEMKAKGFGGALLVDADGSGQRENREVPRGPMFGSPAWRALYRHALKEAARLGVEITLSIQSGWNLGGPGVKPEQAAKLLTWSRTVVRGPAEFRGPLAAPPSRNGFYRDVAVLAYPLRHGEALPGAKDALEPRRAIRSLAVKTASEEAGFSVPVTAPLLDDVVPEPGEQDTDPAGVLTLGVSPAKTFTWRVPEGTWEILRIGYSDSGARVSTSSGGWQGLAIDYMDRAAFEQYWHESVDPLLADARPYVGRTLRYLATDSLELGGTNWTASFREEFRRRRGYDPLPYLPIVAGRIVGSRESSNRFLNDLRRTVGDLILAHHYVPFAEMAARYGLGIHPESGGPHGAPIDALETLGASAFPQTEFWARSATHRTRDEERFFVKQAASAAHIYGKTLVAAEGMTSIGPQWDESIGSNLKPSFDQAACEGLNRLIWHTFTSSPEEAGLPGQEYFAGTHLNPNVTWWHEAAGFLSYINRSQFLLQQGQPVADVAYYYGDHVPNFVRVKSDDPAKVMPGYDYDVVDEEVLAKRMSVRDGRIVLPDGISYRVLVLPNRENISVGAIRALRRLVNGGAIVVGPKPVRATGLDGDGEVRAIADEIWPRVRTGKSAREVLDVPADFETSAPLDYIHRRTSDAEIYFVRNTRPQALQADVTLRVTGKAPELWHPDTGEIEVAPSYDFTADGRTRMPLAFEPDGSIFVIFRRAATAAHHTAAALRERAAVPIGGPWEVEFAPHRGAPAGATFDRLQSWTEQVDPGIRYFSGTATYRTRFRLAAVAPGSVLYLELGDVRELAHVRLNGNDLGVLWKKPFRVKIGGAARAGENRLAIDITNLWPNRLIGDQLLPPGQRITRTNITRYRADSPLLPSGLLGPVVLREMTVR